MAISSSVELYMSGTYWREDETPIAPSFIAWSTRSHIRFNSSGVARRSAFPMTKSRRVPAPTKVARLIALPRRSKVRK